MTAARFAETEVEEAALAWLSALDYTLLPGPQIAPGKLLSERADFDRVVLEGPLRAALARLNPHLPAEAIDDDPDTCCHGFAA